MLVQFNVCNFLSIKEMQSLRMRREDGTGSDCAFIYGPNSSGKSNLIKAIDFSRNLIIGKDDVDYLPYCNLDNEYDESPTYFEYIIEINKRRYSYGFEVDLFKRRDSYGYVRGRRRRRGYMSIMSEWLYDITGNKEKVLIDYDREKPLEVRITNGNGLSLDGLVGAEDVYDWFKNKLLVRLSEPEIECTPVPSDFLEYLNRTLPKLDTGITEIVAEPFINTDIPRNLLKKQWRFMSDDCQLVMVNGNSKKRSWLMFGDGIGTSKLFSEIRFRHGSKHLARIEEESLGTRRIIQLLALMASQRTMDNKGTIVVDEVECSVHALIMAKIVEKIKSEEFKGTQLIFTTHESRLLSEEYSDLEDIWFMDSEKEGKDKHSRLYSLKSFDGTIKKFDVMYLDGRFSAMPRFTPIHLEGGDE